MYADAKKAALEKRYVSVSEFIREALRRLLYPGLTENGFTPEFEEEVLRRERDPNEELIEWDGKTDANALPATGVYYYIVSANEKQWVGKFAFIRK